MRPRVSLTGMLERYAPPGNLVDDVDGDVDLLKAWSAAVSDLLNDDLDGLQYFDQTVEDHGDLYPRTIPWITMPARLANGRTRADALKIADEPAAVGTGREEQREYSEWFTHRDAQKRVIRVDVTTEIPEYWEMFLAKVRPDKVLDLYQQYVSRDVTEADLFDANGVYKPLNRFNSTDGAMHMTCGINTIDLAFGVVSGAMPWFERDGIIVDRQECARDTAGENADPAIQVHVNRLSREQRFLTFADPPGIHILGLDLDGWHGPDGRPVTWEDVVFETRGDPYVRLRIEGSRFALWECTIDGEPIEYGSQIAERITVGPTLAVTRRETIDRTPQPCGATAGPIAITGRRA